jgi:Tubulin like
MTRNPTLILGLGRTGGLVARALRTLLPVEPAAASPRFLLFGSPPPEEGDLSLAQFDSGRSLEEVPLSMDLLRETMSGVREWVGQLPWLARYDESSYLDEIRPLGAAGYRSFARLATVRSDGLIDHALRRALAQVRANSSSEYVDVLLITGTGGGLGSALLADLTFLIQRHARKSTRTACLVLPAPGV